MTEMLYLSSYFSKFKIVDGKTIGDQIHEFENLVKRMKARNSKLDEFYLIAQLLNKFLSSYGRFAHDMRDKRSSTMTMDYVMNVIRAHDLCRRENGSSPSAEGQPC